MGRREHSKKYELTGGNALTDAYTRILVPENWARNKKDILVVISMPSSVDDLKAVSFINLRG